MVKIVLVGTMDSKAAEYEYVKGCLVRMGAEVITVDCSLLDKPCFAVDVPPEEVARAAGYELKDIQFDKEGNGARNRAVQAMSDGAGMIISKLYEEGNLHAVLGLGGGGGTNMLAPAMRKLPIGVPKILVSTIMAGDIRNLVKGTDITMMNAVTDISGINRVSKKILSNAAGGAYGMALNYEEQKNRTDTDGKPVVGITMYGVTTKGVMKVRKRLEALGFEVVCFHSNGTGGFTMEQMACDGILDGVIDFTTAEVTAHYAHGKADGGDDRLIRIARSGIPWVAIPGALDLSNYYRIEDIPEGFRGPERHMIQHNASTFQIRMLAEDFKEIGKVWGERVRASVGPVTVMFPLLGLDGVNEPGGEWFSPEDDRILFETIRRNLGESIRIRELNMHINSEEFAEEVVKEFMDNWKRK